MGVVYLLLFSNVTHSLTVTLAQQKREWVVKTIRRYGRQMDVHQSTQNNQSISTQMAGTGRFPRDKRWEALNPGESAKLPLSSEDIEL